MDVKTLDYAFRGVPYCETATGTLNPMGMEYAFRGVPFVCMVVAGGPEPGADSNIANLAGVAQASISQVAGVAIASCGFIAGVDNIV